MITTSAPHLKLLAHTAADLMAPNPISIRGDANVREALALLTDKGYSAAPVIDEAGRPIGVLSRADILMHDREKPDHVPPSPGYFYEQDLRNHHQHHKSKNHKDDVKDGFQIESVDPTIVEEIMTPAIFSVPPEASATKVVGEMVSLHVHRLFVVDKAGVLVGVITSMDVLKHLKP
jgi:CBS domain-containing protein